MSYGFCASVRVAGAGARAARGQLNCPLRPSARLEQSARVRGATRVWQSQAPMLRFTLRAPSSAYRVVLMRVENCDLLCASQFALIIVHSRADALVGALKSPLPFAGRRPSASTDCTRLLGHRKQPAAAGIGFFKREADADEVAPH